MKRNTILAICLFVGIIGTTQAEVNINIDLGPPPISLSTPTKLIMIPWSGIYFVPDSRVDLFFYKDYWWSARGDGWYRSKQYNGSWEAVQRQHVPSHVLKVPKNYRAVYKNKKTINYMTWEKKHQYKKGKK